MGCFELNHRVTVAPTCPWQGKFKGLLEAERRAAPILSSEVKRRVEQQLQGKARPPGPPHAPPHGGLGAEPRPRSSLCPAGSQTLPPSPGTLLHYTLPSFSASAAHSARLPASACAFATSPSTLLSTRLPPKQPVTPSPAQAQIHRVLTCRPSSPLIYSFAINALGCVTLGRSLHFSDLPLPPRQQGVSNDPNDQAGRYTGKCLVYIEHSTNDRHCFRLTRRGTPGPLHTPSAFHS